MKRTSWKTGLSVTADGVAHAEVDDARSTEQDRGRPCSGPAPRVGPTARRHPGVQGRRDRPRRRHRARDRRHERDRAQREGERGRHVQTVLRLPPDRVWCDNTSEFLAAKLQAGNADVASRSRSHGPGQPRSSRSSRTSPPSRNRPVRPRHHHPENRSPAAPAGPSSYPQSLHTRAHSTTRLRHDPDRRHERPGARCSRLPCQWGGDGCRTLRNSLQRVARVD